MYRAMRGARAEAVPKAGAAESALISLLSSRPRLWIPPGTVVFLLEMKGGDPISLKIDGE
jgi:hypothetical protein